MSEYCNFSFMVEIMVDSFVEGLEKRVEKLEEAKKPIPPSMDDFNDKYLIKPKKFVLKDRIYD